MAKTCAGGLLGLMAAVPIAIVALPLTVIGAAFGFLADAGSPETAREVVDDISDVASGLIQGAEDFGDRHSDKITKAVVSTGTQIASHTLAEIVGGEIAEQIKSHNS